MLLLSARCVCEPDDKLAALDFNLNGIPINDPGDSKLASKGDHGGMKLTPHILHFQKLFR